MFNCLFLLIDSTVLTMIYFSVFNNTQSSTADLCHSFIIHFFHKLDSYKPTLYYSTYQSAYTACIRRSWPMRPETCRANISAEQTHSLKTLCILLDCIYITRWYTVPTLSSYYAWFCSSPHPPPFQKISKIYSHRILFAL